METVKKTIKLYSSAAWRHRGWLILHILTVSIAAISGSIVVPYITSRGINALPDFLSQGGEFWSTFRLYIIGLIGFSLLNWIAWRTSGLAMVKFEIRAMRDLYRKVFSHLMTMSYRFFADTFAGSLVAQTNRFVYSFEKLYDVIAFDVLILVIRYSLATVIIFTFAPTVAMGLLIWSVVFVGSSVTLSIKKLPLSKKAAAQQSRTTARLSDDLTNIPNIKYFAREKFEISGFKQVTSKLAKAQTWDWGIQEIINAWQGLLALAFEIVVFWISLRLVATQQIDLGQLVLIQLYMGNVISSLWSVPKIVRRLESSLADAAEMSEILYEEPDVKDVKSPLACNIKSGLIVFDNVDFDHTIGKIEDSLFYKLSLTIKPGEKIGLVGPSGGGKTTFTKLLLRIADINSGQISIDGQDISQLKQTDLRSCITYVPQEPILFHRSLSENIQYGKPDASIEEIIEAAKKAHANEFINKLPDKYETLVGERGIKLSGGQRQRVTIARAILKDAPILVFDEATSALDSASERLIQDALWKLMENRTAIVVAHRLSTVQRLDRIIVLDDGKVVEDGTHQELLAKKGLYAQLWSHQSGGFLQE